MLSNFQNDWVSIINGHFCVLSDWSFASIMVHSSGNVTMNDNTHNTANEGSRIQHLTELQYCISIKEAQSPKPDKFAEFIYRVTTYSNTLLTLCKSMMRPLCTQWIASMQHVKWDSTSILTFLPGVAMQLWLGQWIQGNWDFAQADSNTVMSRSSWMLFNVICPVVWISFLQC
jgi:hypothetical protein